MINRFGAELRAKRDLFCDGLAELGFTVYRPAATYFATTDIARVAPGMHAYDFCRALPERCGVVAIPSSVFYGPGDPGARGGPWSAGPSASASRCSRRRWPVSPRGADASPPPPPRRAPLA